MSEKIAVSRSYIADMYKACNNEQLQILVKHVDFVEQTITKEGVKELYLIACEDWKKKLLDKFGEFCQENLFVLNKNSIDFNGELKDVFEKLGVQRGNLQIALGCASKEEYKGLGLLIDNMDLEINNVSCGGNGIEIVLRHGTGKVVVNKK